jgi:hypothetical protein
MPSDTDSAARPKAHLAGDTLTIASVAILVYVTGSILHEGVGHGGACLAVGGSPILVSTVNMVCSGEYRVVMAAGTFMNVVTALVFFALGRRTSASAPVWKYFFWLGMTVNLFCAAGYFAFSGVGGFGDWAMFIQGLGSQLAWRIGLTVFGTVTYLLAAWFSLRELRPLIGSDKDLRYRRAVGLAWTPYFTGGILACIAGAFNPAGLILVVLSAAASTFGGTSGLVWMAEWLKGDTIPPGSEAEPAPIPRSWGWIVIAAIAACVFVAVLGPGLRFANG